MSFENIAIKVENLSKCYHIYDNPSDRLKQFVVPRLQRLTWQSPKQYLHEFWALKEVSFKVKKGETAGIIGRNGRCRPCWTQMDWGFILSLDFGLTRQDALVDITQCNLWAADN
jgi:lipopolysaccharide transport system ATP-binding protein